MPTNLFLSHSHQDQRYASIIRDLLRHVSAGQLDVWFSSDDRPASGLSPGDWYQQIRTRLAASKTLIALVTPTSIDNRWIHFECGIGEALNVTVIPVCAGLKSLSDVPPPLHRFQSYQLSDYEALKTFVGKLFNLHGLELFEEVAAPVIRKAIADFSVVTPKEILAPRIQMEDVVELLKSHIDKRLLGAAGSPELSRKVFIPYGIIMFCETPTEDLEVVVNIEKDTTVQDVLDNAYYGISNHVTPFTYLSEWILKNLATKESLVIREITHLIPAHLIFQPGSEWKIVLLSRPYHPSDSDEMVLASRRR